MQSALSAFLVNLAQRAGFGIGIFNGLKGIAYARNFVAGEFLKSDYDRLWFLDSDVIPSENALDLLDVEGDIVAGTYPQLLTTMRGTHIRLSMIAGGEDGKTVDLPDDGVVDVGYVGFGNVLISGEVLRDSRMRLELDGRADEPPAVFSESRFPNGKMHATDDAEFCHRARSFGYSVKCHAGIRFGHVKAVDLNLIRNHSKEWIKCG